MRLLFTYFKESLGLTTPDEWFGMIVLVSLLATVLYVVTQGLAGHAAVHIPINP